MISFLHARRRILGAAVLFLTGGWFLAGTVPAAWRTLNTDFPNYYLTARMVREHTVTTRAYEWMWIEREKDHRELDQRIVGLVPITPFSTLLLLPVAKLAPLTAKHVWIIFNLILLMAVIFLLARVSALPVALTGILVTASYPLKFNFLLGQYYVLLLALLTGACWAIQRRRHVLAGSLIGLAAALKIFPVILVFYLIRKKSWRALAACILSLVAAAAVAIAVLGAGMHRTYLLQVLPATLRGEGLPAFHLGSSSLSTVLHRLFLYEPQWNPHPAIDAPWMFAVLHPFLQLSLLAPAVLAIRPEESSYLRTALEFSGLLLVALAISTSPGTYLFCIALLPVAILCSSLWRTRRYVLVFFTLALFLIISYSDRHIQPRDGWGTLLCVPRLYALILLCLLSAFALTRTPRTEEPRRKLLWLSGLTCMTLLSVASGLRHQRGLFDDYKYRLPIANDSLIAAHPAARNNGNVAFIALTMNGYRATNIDPDHTLSPAADQLSLATRGASIVTEDVLSHSSIRSSTGPALTIDDAESPALSFDAGTVAFLRQVDGRKQLFLRDEARRIDRRITSSPFEAYEADFLPSGELIVSGTRDTLRPTLFRVDGHGQFNALATGEARYPAVSPDGRWLAFSGFSAGNWNLRLLDLRSGTSTRIADVPCNQIEPAWEPDSKTLLYASDCGRSLWFTALARRQVIP